jgi:hypothetical protein
MGLGSGISDPGSRIPNPIPDTGSKGPGSQIRNTDYFIAPILPCFQVLQQNGACVFLSRIFELPPTVQPQAAPSTPAAPHLGRPPQLLPFQARPLIHLQLV